MRFLPVADRIASPWKNGGGQTFQLACHPHDATLENFQWRISMAEVRAAGPFSPFVGIDRQLAVIAGQLTLRIQGREPLRLTPESPIVGFPGELPVSAEPDGGPAWDLNVMTRRATHRATVERIRSPEPVALPLSSGDLMVLVALSPMSSEWSGGRTSLQLRDAQVFDGDDAATVHLRAGPHAPSLHCLQIALSAVG